jgi:hypothetical protein
MDFFRIEGISALILVVFLRMKVPEFIVFLGVAGRNSTCAS